MTAIKRLIDHGIHPKYEMLALRWAEFLGAVLE